MERHHVTGVGIALAGVVLAVVQTVHGLAQSGSALVLAFEAGPFVLVALALAYTGYWLARHGTYAADAPRILAWGAGTTLLFASLAALMLFSQQVTLGTLERASYIAIDNVTIGAVVGVLLGLYDARSRERLRDLERERDRTEAFANKAADVNNYGRVLNRSDSVDEVSALCVQATQALLGTSEVATLAVAEGDWEVVDNTVLNVSEDGLRTLGKQSLDQEQSTVVRHGNGQTGLDREFVTMRIATPGDGSFVLVAAAGEATAFADEDVELLELLGSHTGTALANIHGERGAPSPADAGAD